MGGGCLARNIRAGIPRTRQFVGSVLAGFVAPGAPAGTCTTHVPSTVMADAFSGSSLTVDRSRQELTDGLVPRLEYSGFLVDAAGGTDPDETMDHNVPASLASMANETGVEVTPDWIRSLALAVTAVDTSGQ